MGNGLLSAQRPRSCKIGVPPPSQDVPARWDWYSLRLVAFRAPSGQSLPATQQANSSRHLRRKEKRPRPPAEGTTLPHCWHPPPPIMVSIELCAYSSISAERGLKQRSEKYFSAPRHIARVGRSECPRCDDLATHGFRPLPTVVRNATGLGAGLRWHGSKSRRPCIHISRAIA